MTSFIKTFVLSLVCTLFLTFNADAQQNLRSGAVQTKTSTPTLTFSNNTTIPVDVFWNNGQKEIKYASLQPSKSYAQSTYTNHEWVIRTENGTELKRLKAGSIHQDVRVNLKSVNSNTAVKVHMNNPSNYDVVVNWVDYKGKEISYLTLQPGKNYTQSTFATHPWIARHKHTNEILAVMIPTTSTDQTFAVGPVMQTNNQPVICFDDSYSPVLPNATEDDVQKSDVEQVLEDVGSGIEDAAKEVENVFKGIFDF